VSPAIERIEHAGPDRRARRLFFSDYEDPRTTSATALRLIGLEPGDEIDRDELEAQLAEYEPACARERALRVLSYRERSVKELSKRLVDDGYPNGVVRELVERLSELGLVDDARFAAAWARARAGAGFGPDRISRELREKGIDDELAADAVTAAFGDQDPIERARALLGAERFETRAQRDRAVRRLVRKGFSLSTALKATEDRRD